MKVVHISTSDTGGAGSAAVRLHKGLLNEGVDSKVLCLEKRSGEEGVYCFDNWNKVSIFQKVIRNLGMPVTQKEKNKKILQKHPGNYELFTFLNTDFDVLKSPLVAGADIINLHWIAGFLDYQSFFKNIGKPVVWTLHDKNPTLGGFHLLSDQQKNSSFSTLEQGMINDKLKRVQQVGNLSVVSPSKFLLNYSKSSRVLSKYLHYNIPNAIDTTLFKPNEQISSRRLFNLPENKIIVLFIASRSEHKGIDLLYECIRMNELKNLQFVALGDASSAGLTDIINIKSIHDERLLSVLYSAADLFVLPSREDNLPNAMLESLACGTPVLGFPTGGIPDVIQHGVNGLLTIELSADALYSSIASFYDGTFKFDRNLIREYAVKNFQLSVQAKRYIELYESLLV